MHVLQDKTAGLMHIKKIKDWQTLPFYDAMHLIYYHYHNISMTVISIDRNISDVCTVPVVYRYLRVSNNQVEVSSNLPSASSPQRHKLAQQAPSVLS